MAEAVTNPCAGCQRLQAQLEQLQAAVARLEEQLAAARKASSPSSKPPSSDLVKPPAPPPPPGQDQRKRGGQPGHPKHERALFPTEQVDLTASSWRSISVADIGKTFHWTAGLLPDNIECEWRTSR